MGLCAGEAELQVSWGCFDDASVVEKRDEKYDACTKREESVKWVERSGAKCSRTVHLEQNSAMWMNDLVSRFLQLGQVVGDENVRPFTTRAAYVKLPKHRNFFGCKIDRE